MRGVWSLVKGEGMEVGIETWGGNGSGWVKGLKRNWKWRELEMGMNRRMDFVIGLDDVLIQCFK